MTLDVLCSPQPKADEICLQTLAQFLGLHVRRLSNPTEDEAAPETPVHIAATCRSLEDFLSRPLARPWLSRRLARKHSSLFLTGIGTSAADLDTITKLIPGVVEQVTPAAAHGSEYEIAAGPRSGMPQFSGITFGPVDGDADGVFALCQESSHVTELITIGGRPCYVIVEKNGASYFLLACARVLDLDAPAEPGQQPIDRFLRFVPFLAHLRLTFGAHCWKNDQQAACLIIDDPLLRKRYGFLDFNRLESHMADSRFSMNVAFIPWNCRRTNRSIAEKFKRSDRRFSISIHGCDHTEAEFGIADEAKLRHRSRRALSRMDVHQGLTGIKHNRVMVFPQGVFSKTSLRALDDEGFLAAVNSSIYPVDAMPGEVTVRDLLDVAVVHFGGAPLFLRRYPDRLENISLDLFLGRQVLIVEHHGFFRRGYDEAERCAAFVNKIAPDIAWTDLEELCTSACLVREAPDGTHVRAFGSILRMRNRQSEGRRFRVSNPGERGSVESVTWRGRTLAFEANLSGTFCDVILDSWEEGVLHFQRRTNDLRVEDPMPTLKDRFKVFARRHLSEVRDNYLDRSPMLSELAKRGKTLLPRM